MCFKSKSWAVLTSAVPPLCVLLVDEAAKQAHSAIMFNMGQCCCAGSRTYVQESVYDEFVAKSKALAEARKVGDPFDGATQHGPQVGS